MYGGWRARAALLLAAVPAAAGCCSLQRAVLKGNRDTPEAAFAFVRDAFAADQTGDQYDSFHPDFREAQGISASRYSLARGLAPGLFAKASALLGSAALEGVERGTAPVATRRGPRAWARVVLRTAEGRGVFLLVDEPAFRLYTSDGEIPDAGGPAEGIGRAVRVEGDRLVVEFRAPLATPPLPGSEVHRFEVHHDWLLYAIEELRGFDEFLDEVKSTAEEAAKEEGPP